MTDRQSAAPSRVPAKAGAAALAIAAAIAAVAPFTAAHEGEKYRAYRDVAGVWTICDGHTAGVRAGQTATRAQCQALLRADLAIHMAAAVRATPQLVGHPGPMKAAGDFAFNVGDGAYAHSTVARRFAAGDWRGGCDALLMWAYATVNGRKVVVPGLLRRRQDERGMCLAQISA